MLFAASHEYCTTQHYICIYGLSTGLTTPYSPASAAARPLDLPRLTRGARQVQHDVRRDAKNGLSWRPDRVPNCRDIQLLPHRNGTLSDHEARDPTNQRSYACETDCAKASPRVAAA